MRRAILLWVLAGFVLTASASKTTSPSRARSKPHPCCYCACHLPDYYKDCHKLCVLPKDKEGKLRAFTENENRFCVELCALKKEGSEHLKH